MYYYIVNPAAGGGRINKVQYKLQQMLRDSGIDGEFVKTTGKGDAARIVKIAQKDGATNIVAVGGDSTVSEVINSFSDENNNVLGVIPIGRTNILANSLGIRDWQQAINVLKKRRIKTIDLGKVNDKYFITSLEIGFETDFVKERGVFSLFRNILFMKKVFKKIISYKPFEAKLNFDHNFELESKIFNISIISVKYSNRIDDAFQNDGKLTVYLIPDQPRSKLLKNFHKISNCDYRNISFVTKLRAKSVSIDTGKKSQNVYADSSFIGTTPVLVEVSSKKIKAIVSKERSFK